MISRVGAPSAGDREEVQEVDREESGSRRHGLRRRRNVRRLDVRRRDLRRRGLRRRGLQGVDDGSGVVWVVMMMALLAAFALTALAVGGAVVSRHRASSAADFAALAAADALARGTGDPCRAAWMVAERYGSALTSCVVSGLVVDVVIEMPAGGLAGSDDKAVVRARAGPS